MHTETGRAQAWLDLRMGAILAPPSRLILDWGPAQKAISSAASSPKGCGASVLTQFPNQCRVQFFDGRNSRIFLTSVAEKRHKLLL